MVLAQTSGVSVYILILRGGRTYTGISKNLTSRLIQHASGQSRSSKRFLPVSLVHTVLLENYKLARSLEVKIKNRGAKRWLPDSHFRKADVRLIRPGDLEFPTDKQFKASLNRSPKRPS